MVHYGIGKMSIKLCWLGQIKECPFGNLNILDNCENVHNVIDT